MGTTWGPTHCAPPPPPVRWNTTLTSPRSRSGWGMPASARPGLMTGADPDLRTRRRLKSFTDRTSNRSAWPARFKGPGCPPDVRLMIRSSGVPCRATAQNKRIIGKSSRRVNHPLFFRRPCNVGAHHKIVFTQRGFKSGHRLLIKEVCSHKEQGPIGVHTHAPTMASNSRVQKTPSRTVVITSRFQSGLDAIGE